MLSQVPISLILPLLKLVVLSFSKYGLINSDYSWGKVTHKAQATNHKGNSVPTADRQKPAGDLSYAILRAQ